MVRSNGFKLLAVMTVMVVSAAGVFTALSWNNLDDAPPKVVIAEELDAGPYKPTLSQPPSR